jgi:hypothetical protein
VERAAEHDADLGAVLSVEGGHALGVLAGLERVGLAIVVGPAEMPLVMRMT